MYGWVLLVLLFCLLVLVGVIFILLFDGKDFLWEIGCWLVGVFSGFWLGIVGWLLWVVNLLGMGGDVIWVIYLGIVDECCFYV